MRLPFLKLDLEKVASNIKTMADNATKHKLEFRPHFKTHQSLVIAQLFKEHGVTGITVSSIYMADFFSKHGWNDITVAFPAGLSNVKLYDSIAKRSKLKVLAVDKAVVKKINNAISESISMYIEIDPGYGRSGIRYDNFALIDELLTAINSSENIQFEGFYCHAGHTYKCTSKKEIVALTDPILESLGTLKTKYGGNISFGDTPSCSVRDNFDGIDQISPGNFVFYDWMQTQIGACTPEQIAVTMHCEVVAKFPERNEVLIHGGAVHFSKDFVLNKDGERVYGFVKSKMNAGSESYIKSLSQEHGLVACSQAEFSAIEIGDIIEVFPIHSCLTANLMREYVTASGKVIPQFGSGSPYQR
ncbi:MAG: alanine racemase [Balneolaceae bacterium]|nr:alanine racemase [Balneolaceae bacterium]